MYSFNEHPKRVRFLHALNSRSIKKDERDSHTFLLYFLVFLGQKIGSTYLKAVLHLNPFLTQQPCDMSNIKLAF